MGRGRRTERQRQADTGEEQTLRSRPDRHQTFIGARRLRLERGSLSCSCRRAAAARSKRVERGGEGRGDLVGGWWAARHADVDGQDALDAQVLLARVAEQVAAQRAVAERGDEARL